MFGASFGFLPREEGYVEATHVSGCGGVTGPSHGSPSSPPECKPGCLVLGSGIQPDGSNRRNSEYFHGECCFYSAGQCDFRLGGQHTLELQHLAQSRPTG